MFTIILLTATTGYFYRAGERIAIPVYPEATAADVLRIARQDAANRRYHAVGIRVGNRANSPVMWVK